MSVRSLSISNASGSKSSSYESSIEGYGNLAARTRFLVFNLFYLVNKEAQSLFPTLRNILFFVELVQFFSFVLAPGITDWGSGTGDLFYYLSYIRIFAVLSFHDHSAVFWCIFAYLLVFCVLGLELSLHQDAHGTRRFKLFCYLSVIVTPVVYLPFLNIVLGFLNCSNDDGETNATHFLDEHISCLGGPFLVSALFAFGMLIALIVMTFASVFFIQDYHHEKKQIYCRSNSRLLLLFFASKTFLTFSQEYLVHVPNHLHVGIYNWIGIAVTAGLFVYCVYFLPFYRAATNYLFCGFMSVSFLGFLCGFSAGLSNVDGKHSITTLIVFLVMAIPFTALALILTGMFRIRKLYNWKYTPVQSFQRAFEAEICSRGAQQASVINDDLVINTFTLGIENFPTSSQLKAGYALYLLERNNDFALLTLILDRLRNDKMHPDVKFLVFCLEKERLNIAMAQDGGTEEIQAKLHGVKKHSNRAKMWMRRFWDMLLKEEDLGSLPDVVANMDMEETKAEAILTKLREKFPRNVVVLRHYAVFLERVKNDPDAAQLALRMADDLEEEKTTNHRKKTSRRDKQPMSKAVSTQDMPHAQFIEIKEASALSKQTTVHFSDGENLGYELQPRLPNSVSYSDQPDPITFGEDSHPTDRKEYGDDKSTVSGSSYSFTHLRTMKRSDVLRYRKYKYLTENSRSKALSKLTVAISVSLLLLLANIISVFATAEYMISTFDASVTAVKGASSATVYVHEGALGSLKIRLGVLTNNSDFIEDAKDEMSERMDLLEEVIKRLFSTRTNYDRLKQGWIEQKYEIANWDVSDQTNTFRKQNLWDSTSEFLWRARDILNADHKNLVDLNQSVPLRFVLDNAPHSIYHAMTDLVALYQERNTSVSLFLTLVVAILIPVTFLILVVLGALLLYPAVREIKLERAATLRLFLSVPKSSVSAIVNRLRVDDDQTGDDIADVSEVSNLELKEEFMQFNTESIPVLRSFVIKYFVSLVLVFAGICAIAFIALSNLDSMTKTVSEIAAATGERVLGTRLQFESYCLAFADYDQLYSAPYRETILADADEITALDVKLRFGDKGDKLPGDFEYNSYLFDFYFGQSCPELEEYNLTCTGYVSMLHLIRDQALDMLNYNDTELGFGAVQIEIEDYIEELYFDPWTDQLSGYFENQARSTLHKIDIIVIVLFILLLPSLLVILFVLRPIVNRIRLESTRTVKMMLMVPFEVIDSIHPIRDFLNTGQHTYAKQKQKTSGIESNNDDLTRIVFNKIDRAIVVTTAGGEIDVFNNHAERLFGYSRTEVFGKNFSYLLPTTGTSISSYNAAATDMRKLNDSEEKQEMLEVSGKLKSNDIIPIRVTMVQAKVTGKPFIVHYIDDITQVRRLEANVASQMQAFDTEKQKMQSFMYNMFPKSIAEQLMIANETNNNNLIAEEYKEVTILFADIVGFTNMCSHLEPAALLIILNGIFLKWDALVEKYDLQKIKTIGDCYMVAGGLPERTIDHAERMLEFALEMIEALNSYNHSNEFLNSRGLALSLRVGINTGPVVAGIIGNSRICFDLWGDAVNVASRMESTSIEGRIQVSQSTFNRTKINFDFEERGTVEVKGKGVMLTYLLVGKRFLHTPGGTTRDMRFLKHQSPMRSVPSKINFPPSPLQDIEIEHHTSSSSDSMTAPLLQEFK